MSTTMSTFGCISYVVLRDYSLPGRTSSTSTSSCTASTRPLAAAALRQPCCAPRVLVPRLQRLYINYVARPGASARRAARPRLVAPLVVDNSASRRLVVDYFASAARPGASARRAARHAARHAARSRLLRLAQARRRLLRIA
jgi:hypothetical protein